MQEDHLQQQIAGFLNTPAIWLNSQFGIRQFHFPQVDVLNFSPSPIPQKIRLGHQMEHVCKQLLDHSDTYEVLLYNLPIREGKQTIGEIDFILKEKATQQLVHVELTYKFYIIDPSISESIHQLMGPNRRDMFFTKMEKIKNAQFALLHSLAGSSALAQHDINSNEIQHQACYKAQLFEPYGSAPLHLRPLNPKCIVGYWLRMTDLQTDAFKNYQFYIPYKTQWVVAPHAEMEWTSHYETLLEINLRLIKQNAPMVWMKKSETEFEKFFVVWW
ncbi:DUF1853 family protein [Maribacter chungangensis]|uniref:DUF1853 family protein n=1 Tax=Maribacter chungangensis TaxID=1069117 RepID=A0ABW3B4I6_9FLAO